MTDFAFGHFGPVIRFLGSAFIADFDVAIALEVFAVLATPTDLGKLAGQGDIAAHGLIRIDVADDLQRTAAALGAKMPITGIWPRLAKVVEIMARAAKPGSHSDVAHPERGRAADKLYGTAGPKSKIDADASASN